MGVIGGLLRRLSPARAAPSYPALPQPQDRYVLVTSDMTHFDLLDGEEECGGVELRDNSEEDPTPWAVHVYGIDLAFPNLGKARAWLGKPEIRLE